MLIWLVKWRQTIGLVLLVSLVWGSGGQEQPEGLERLSGWWVATEQGSGYGQWSSEWVQRCQFTGYTAPVNNSNPTPLYSQKTRLP